tara:strand:+ start:1157 stop:1306 length:150 start_codon:yes stop_codon:yes gene_type:complete
VGLAVIGAIVFKVASMGGAGGDGSGVQMSGKSGLIDESKELKLTGTSKI